MLKFNDVKEVVVPDNEIIVSGKSFGFLTDDQARKIIDMVLKFQKQNDQKQSDQQVSTPAQKTYNPAPEQKNTQPIVGKKLWQETFLTVSEENGDCRLYITCFVKGEKGEKIRYAIKSEAKKYGARWTGDIKKSIIHWTFPSKQDAEKFIEARKNYNKKEA